MDERKKSENKMVDPTKIIYTCRYKKARLTGKQRNEMEK